MSAAGQLQRAQRRPAQNHIGSESPKPRLAKTGSKLVIAAKALQPQHRDSKTRHNAEQIKTRLAQRAEAQKLVASAEAKIDCRRQETQRAAKEAARDAMAEAKARTIAIDAEREADARRNVEEYAAAQKLMLKADEDRAIIQANIKAEQGVQNKLAYEADMLLMGAQISAVLV